MTRRIGTQLRLNYCHNTEEYHPLYHLTAHEHAAQALVAQQTYVLTQIQTVQHSAIRTFD
jgi:hypothetical protein